MPRGRTSPMCNLGARDLRAWDARTPSRAEVASPLGGLGIYGSPGQRSHSPGNRTKGIHAEYAIQMSIRSNHISETEKPIYEKALVALEPDLNFIHGWRHMPSNLINKKIDLPSI